MSDVPPSDTGEDDRLIFTLNDPFDADARIRLVIPQRIGSSAYMQSVREFRVPSDSVAMWFLGQNSFLLKDPTGLLIGIDLYLTNSCAQTFRHLPFRCDRQLPIFIEPEDLDVDVFITTHSHQDHADPETILRMPKTQATMFVGPFDSMRVFAECGVPGSSTRLVHPGERIQLNPKVSAQCTFAMPTDASDLNHTGILIEFSNGIRFFNTGDTAYAETLMPLLPTEVDICAICINGGFLNLSAMQAASIIKTIRPSLVIPCHYDMMVNNVGSPEMFKVALAVAGSGAEFMQLKYYEPTLYTCKLEAESSTGLQIGLHETNRSRQK